MADMAEFINDSHEQWGSEGYEGFENTSVSCRYCGRAGLVWGPVFWGNFGYVEWRLFDGENIHTCKQYRKMNK